MSPEGLVLNTPISIEKVTNFWLEYLPYQLAAGNITKLKSVPESPVPSLSCSAKRLVMAGREDREIPIAKEMIKLKVRKFLETYDLVSG